MSPISLRIQVAQRHELLYAQANLSHAASDLARDKVAAAPRRLVVEQDAVDSEHAVSLAVVDRDPVGVDFGGAVRRPRIKRGRLLLRDLLYLAEHLRGGGLVEADLLFQVACADGVQDSQSSDGVDLGGVLGQVEGDLHMALCAQVINLVRLNLADQFDEVCAIR